MADYSDEPTKKKTPEQKDEQELLDLAKERFKAAFAAEKDDWASFKEAEDFLAHDQWDATIKAERQAADRPCLTLDHLNQYVRHVINAGLMRSRDVRVMPMDGEADEEVGDILAGLMRQIMQRSSSKIAYERGLRHSCGKGKGYWECKVVNIEGSKEHLQEIEVRPIRDPRMVLMDNTCTMPDGRDARWAFKLTKLSNREFKAQYGDKVDQEGIQSWHDIDKDTVLPFIAEGSNPVVVATYYYKEKDGQWCWAVMIPNKVLEKDTFQGSLPPIIRCVGDEFEYQGKERTRGLVNPSSIDAQKAYNYSASACIESAALAPLAPFVAAAGQTEEFATEWAQANRVSRPVLRYNPVTVQGQLAPPPMRQEPAQLSPAWAGMLQQLLTDEQGIMGMAQPNVLGIGGAPVQSGAGLEAQKDPGDINVYHYHEHWYDAIEQTGRVILSMIPHVYDKKQVVMIVGKEGDMEKVTLNPQQQQPVEEMQRQVRTAMALKMVTDKTYNHLLGRYDIAISTGPSSATQKAESSELSKAIVQAYPEIMTVAGDLIIRATGMAGADQLADRLKKTLPPGLAEDDDDVAQMAAKLKEAAMQVQQLQQQNQEMEKIILGEREKAAAKLQEAQIDAQTKLEQEQMKSHRELTNAQLDGDREERIQARKIQAEIQMNTENNTVHLIETRINAGNKVDIEVLKHFSKIAQIESQAERMAGYGEVINKLGESESGTTSERSETP